ncbi:MAG: signal transduction histidine kinase, partial [Candidatus Aminicenantes bacterium]|nr:signal transduction histidine kinase [Candidatus Aminicenantes bacterium]
VVVLVGALLFVVQRREAAILSADAESRAVLIAESLRDANFESLLRSDRDAIQEYVDSHAGQDLPYIVFYDRAGEPYVASPLARAREEIAPTSSLPPDASPRDPPFSEQRTIDLAGQRIRVREVEIPVFPPDRDAIWASVKIGMSLEPMYAGLREVRKVLLFVGAGGFLLGILGAAILARRITRPLNRLVEGTVRIAKGDFSQAMVDTSGDEVGDLARSFNEMIRQLLHARQRMEEANRKLVQHEKLASIGRMAATIAHEIRNPLTSAKLNIQKVVEEERFAEAVKTHLGMSLEGIDQIERFIKELLNFTRVPELSLESWPIEQIVEESLKVVADTLAEKGIVIEKSCAAGLPHVFVDADKMRQVFLNILRNAQEALEAGGRIHIACDAVEDGLRKKVRVRITDNGPGIPDKVRPNIFEPFFTTKPSGFGLGLPNARKIVEQHNGTIHLVRKRGRGSSFVVLIPAEEAS